jgi:hypothetical protein
LSTNESEESPKELKLNDQIDIFDEEQKQLLQQQEIFKTLFKNCVFFLTREVTLHISQFDFVLIFFTFLVFVDLSEVFVFRDMKLMGGCSIGQVPRESLEFVILSFGGEVILDEDQENNNRITHQIVDNDFQKHWYGHDLQKKIESLICVISS